MTSSGNLARRLEEVLKAMPVAVSWARLSDQKIVYLNRKFQEMFGYVLGDHATVQDWIEQTYPNPEQAERAASMWYPYFGITDVEVVEIPQVEVDVLCKEGSIKSTLLGGMILPDVGWALATFVDITALKESEARIQKLALEDVLTGLANRRAFAESLGRALARASRQHRSVALLLLDLDGFKPLNDSLGHDRGDAILQEIARRTRAGIRATDQAFRIGGDEFAVIAEAIDDVGDVEQIAERLMTEIRRPFTLDDVPVPLSVSIGIGLYPGKADDKEALYHNADQALYRAKHAGRGCWRR